MPKTSNFNSKTTAAINYQPLSNLMRPLSWQYFLYNEQITTVLKNIILSGNIPPGILFSGIQGVGKTTASRLFARALNCQNKQGADPCGQCDSCIASLNGSHPDIIEISGSTNGNIEDIRKIIDQASLSPFMSSYKVFIIDEAQGLGRSQSSFDSLLKILEEPPPNVVWILCTTQKTKIPATIKSRLVSMDLKSIPTAVLERYILSLLGLVYKHKGKSAGSIAGIIARSANNSVRDSLTILERVGIFCQEKGWTVENALSSIGAFDETRVGEILNYIINHDSHGLWICIESIMESGIDITVIFSEGLVTCVSSLMGVALGASSDRGEVYIPAFQQLGIPRVMYLSDVVAKRSQQFYEAVNKKFMLQLITLEMCA